MLLQPVVFALGLGVLYLGADWLVRGASSLALHFGIRPLVVGLTIVALGTSMPEFLLNLFAVAVDEHSLAMGNILGSNIANIALILGISAAIIPLTVDRGIMRREYPMVLGVSLVFWLLASDGTVSRIDGFILVSGLVGFLSYLIVDGRRHAREKAHEAAAVPGDEASEAGQAATSAAIRDDESGTVASKVPESEEESDPTPLGAISRIKLSGWGRALSIIGGGIALAVGARLMIISAVSIADGLGVSHVIIGLTIVAIGTSLPELAASMVCAMRKDADMAVGNILGSNLLNMLFVVGTISLFRPLTVEPVALSIHFPVMIAFTALLLPLAWTSFRLTRLEGFLLLAAYIAYMIFLVFQA